MTISISSQAYNELLQQQNVGPQHPDPNDALDVMLKHSPSLGSGCWQHTELREGLEVTIGDFRFCDRLVATYPEGEADWLAYHFHFSGTHQDEHTCISAGQFAFSGTGLTPKVTRDCLDTQPYLEVQIYIKPETLHSFTSDPAEELPPELQPLIRPPDQQQYCRTGTATPVMQTVARRILQCPYREIGKVFRTQRVKVNIGRLCF